MFAQRKPPTVAVTPFQNFTTEANDFFAQGLMQELAAAFAASRAAGSFEERPQCDRHPGGQRPQIGRTRSRYGATR